MSWITVQDDDGVLHFGCDALVSYDGERWRTAPVPNGYALRGLDFATDGRLWAAANGNIGWFDRQPGGRWEFRSLLAALPPTTGPLGEVWNVFGEGVGAVFVTQDKVIRWDGNAARVWPLPGPGRLEAIRSAGTIYIHHRPTGLYAVEASGIRMIFPPGELPDSAIFWLERSADGWLFAASGGFYAYAKNRLTPFAPDASEFIRRHALTCALRLSDGRLAVGTFRGGIVLLRPDGSIDQTLNENDGLPTPAIFSLMQDRDGELWVTSGSHIFRIAIGRSVALLDGRSGLPIQPILKIVRHDGRIAVSVDSGVFELQPDGQHFRPVEALRARFPDMLSTSRGLLLGSNPDVTLMTGGVARVVLKNKIDTYALWPSLRQPGTFLASVGQNIVSLQEDGSSRTLVESLPDSAQTLAEDAAGVLWLGTWAAGVLMAHPQADVAVEATRATAAQGLPTSVFRSAVVGSPDGTVLVFSTLGGWIKGRTAGRFEPIANYPARGSPALSNVDASGAAWVVLPAVDGRPACLGKIAVTGDHAAWEPQSIEGLWEVGMPRTIFAENPDATTTVLWIGGTNGILRATVAAGAAPPPLRAPLLRAFTQGNDHAAPHPIAGTVPYSTRSVMFEFAAPEFSRRPALRLETRVEGIDSAWVPADPTSRREFTAVRDGNYVFRVRTLAETGATSVPTEFAFTVAPPWWRTGPAIAAGLLAFGAALYGVYHLRIRALRQRNAELEEKVRERTDELAQASAAKTQFVANMSHDIRNPLNGIVGLTLALEDSRLDPKQREVVATLRECTTYLSSLVDDVLDFASIEAGRVELRPETFAPAELLRSVMATLKVDAASCRATLVLEQDPKLPDALVGDTGRIQQILVNYGSNALKYAGGVIRFSARVLPDSRDEIEFAVTDAGPGLTEADQSGLFTKFNRLPGARASEVAGTGLGLASCRLLADLMGGSVGVDSAPARGARFYLRLPLETSANPVAADNVTLPNATVLVVEDTDYNAMAAAAVLAKLGLTSERARTGEEALRLFAERRFNVVLLDRNLPDLDGTEVARRIRELEGEVPQAILLAVTAYCTAEDRQLCLDAGMDAFVGKPLTPEKLRKILIAAGRRLLTAASVHVPPEAPAGEMNFSLLDYISDGTEEGRSAQIGRFLTALAEAEAQLNRAAAIRDPAALGAAAHVVLAQAKFVGADSLEREAIRLEQAARRPDASAAAEPLQSVRREIAAVTAAMDRHLRAEPSK